MWKVKFDVIDRRTDKRFILKFMVEKAMTDYEAINKVIGAYDLYKDHKFIEAKAEKVYEVCPYDVETYKPKGSFLRFRHENQILKDGI